MRKNILIKSILLVLMITIYSVFCSAYRIERADKVNITVKASISFNDATDKYEYNYTVTSHEDSEQDLTMIFIEYNDIDPEITVPENWDGDISRWKDEETGEYLYENRTPNNRLKVTFMPDDNLEPGNTQENLILKTKGLPAIVTFYARGYAPAPVSDYAAEKEALINQYRAEGNFEELERIEKYEGNETPENPELRSVYVNSFKGKTLGPVGPPEVFNPISFTDQVIAYTEEAGTLEWISDTAVVTSIKNKLTNAKKKIGTDNPGAIATLDTILTDLETQHGTSVNDEAYFLLKFNVMYLKDKL